MALNDAASADRIHIGFFGKRNAGKSSLVNAVTGQALSVVSDTPGTTTDPVRKAMELLPLGPVVIIDTPGLDDEGELGALRVKTARLTLGIVDIAVIVVDSAVGITEHEQNLKRTLEEKNIPFIIAFNKCELLKEAPSKSGNEIYVSAKMGIGINELKEKMASLLTSADEKRVIIGDLIDPCDRVLLVVPIDKAAPKGRLILPQQQTIRDILDSGAFATVVRDSELKNYLDSSDTAPRLVITDSQAFGKVAKILPESIPLTSFSILFARYKGNLEGAVKGAAMLDRLKNGDKVLISEGCTHHRQCGDIGTEKLPKWIKEYTGRDISFDFTSGRDFPEEQELSKYALVIHCGGCMLTERQMKYRAALASEAGVPITNYGMVIAHTHGILKRSLEPFGDIAKELD